MARATMKQEPPFARLLSLMRLLLLATMVHESRCLRMISSHFPKYVVLGSSLNMTCTYDVQGGSIYQVKWYKGGHEFYSFVPGKPSRTYNVRGIHLDLERCGSRSVVLGRVDRYSQGMFSCEVTVHRTYDTKMARGYVTVVELPLRGPAISGAHSQYMDAGETLRLNCTSRGSRPAASIKWYINGVPANPAAWEECKHYYHPAADPCISDHNWLQYYNNSNIRGDVSDRDVGRSGGDREGGSWGDGGGPDVGGDLPDQQRDDDVGGSTLELALRLRSRHFNSAGVLTLKCTAQIADIYYSSIDRLVLSRSQASRAELRSAGWRLYPHWHTAALWTVFVTVYCRCVFTKSRPISDL